MSTNLYCGADLNGFYKFGEPRCSSEPKYILFRICRCDLTSNLKKKNPLAFLRRNTSVKCEDCALYASEQLYDEDFRSKVFCSREISKNVSFTLPHPTLCFRCLGLCTQTFFLLIEEGYRFPEPQTQKEGAGEN